MGDVHCQVCREPWDAYGVRNGDMCKWEADLFLGGEGCPCCKGDSGQRNPGPMELLAGMEPPPRGEWVRPKPEILWACDGCDVQAQVDPDDGEPHWGGGRSVHYSRGHGFRYGQIGPARPEVEAHAVIAEQTYCPGCAELCYECREVFVFTRDRGTTGPYDPGAGFVSDNGRPICVTCFEEQDRSEEE